MECIAKADVRLLYDEYGAMISPAQWPDEVALAVRKVSPHASGGFIVDFQDKRNAADILAKLKGLYDNDEQFKNPLEQAFEKIPRDDLIKMVELLKELARLADE